ncbi:MAG: hypothetical protein B6U89_01100 [Desulfurococcales archaeon ex4484_58]|nr:MAG: hypothetical protein B6U89_01100 [Desulfurococcales archaeon ex4484_58]
MYIVKDYTDSYGCFYVYIQIPLSASLGYHITRVRDSSGRESSTVFEVTNPVSSIKPLAGTVGSRVQVSVTGLTPETFYTVKINDLTIYPFVMSNANGKLNLEFEIPPLPNGTHEIRIVYPATLIRYEDTNRIIESFDVIKISFNVLDGVVLSSSLNKTLDTLKEVRYSLHNVTSKADSLEYRVRDLEQKLNTTNQELITVRSFITVLLIVIFILGVLLIVSLAIFIVKR